MLKKDWAIIDRRASQANVEHGKTYEKLIKFIEEPIKHNVDRDIFMTRGLLYWLKCNSDLKKEHGKDSPLTLAYNMFSGKVGYADAFTTLCKKANIQCETVSGVAKTGDYKPGDLKIDKEKMISFWNKVYLLGKWWPIHPRYVLRSIKGPAQASGYKKIDSDVKGDSENQSTGAQETGYTFNDFWFLADPEIFIHKCYPDNPDDQMLPAAKRIRKARQYMKLPYLTPVFHEYKLKMTSEETCIIDTTDGLAKISFKANRKLANIMVCDYSLSIGERLGDDTSQFDFDSANLVFSSRKKNQFMFEVRCPVEANYMISISGGDIESDIKKVLIKSKIVCKERMPVVRTFPIDAGQIGWGFGPAAIKVGLLKPNISKPKIYIQPMSTGNGAKSIVKMKFGVDERNHNTVNYTVELVRAGEIKSTCKDHVQTTLTKEPSELTIVCSVPDDGEYALVIKAKDVAESEFRPVCNYLLTTLENEDDLSDDYYDSSDGTSDIDDEIEELERKLMGITEERDKILKQKKSRPTNVDRSAYDEFCKTFRTSSKHSKEF